MTVERGFEFYSKDDSQVVTQLQMFHGTLYLYEILFLKNLSVLIDKKHKLKMPYENFENTLNY